jgi:transcriptional regulator with XRE-family HTH domain
MRSDVYVIAEDLRRHRVAAGLSLRVVSRAARIDHARLWRFERGLPKAVTLEELAAVGAIVGLDVRLRAFAAGDPIRDAGQERLLARLRQLLPSGLTWRTEVPLPIEGDLRAWDAMIGAPTWRLGIDAETVLTDVQAIDRRFQLKAADSGLDLVLLLVADTSRNRRAVKAAPAAFGTLSREARPLLRALRAGERPPESALIFL